MIPDDSKLPQALFVCHSEYLRFISSTITQTPKNIKEINVNIDEKQAEATHERVLTSCFLSLATAIDIAEKHENSTKMYEAISMLLRLDTTEQEKASKNQKLLFHQFFENPSISNTVKASLLTLMCVCLKKLHPLDINKNIVLLSRLVFYNALADKDRIIQRELWGSNIMVVIFEKISKELLTKLDRKKVETNLLEVIKHCGYGAEKNYLSNLIFILAKMPYLELLDVSNEKEINDRLNLLKLLLSNFLESILNEEARFYIESYYKTYQEILVFFITKRFSKCYKNLIESGFKTAPIKLNDLISELVCLPILKYANNFDENQGASRDSKNDFFRPIPTIMAQFFSELEMKPESELSIDFFECLLEYLSGNLLKLKKPLSLFYLVSVINSKVGQSNKLNDYVSNFIIKFNKKIVEIFTTESLDPVFKKEKFGDIMIENKEGDMKILISIFEMILTKNNLITSTVLNENYIASIADTFLMYTKFTLSSHTQIIKNSNKEVVAGFLAKMLVQFLFLPTLTRKHSEIIFDTIFSNIPPIKNSFSFEWLLVNYFLNPKIDWHHIAESQQALALQKAKVKLVLDKNLYDVEIPDTYSSLMVENLKSFETYSKLLNHYLECKKNTAITIRPFVQAGFINFVKHENYLESLENSLVSYMMGNKIGSKSIVYELLFIYLLKCKNENRRKSIFKSISTFTFKAYEKSERKIPAHMYQVIKRIKEQSQETYLVLIQSLAENITQDIRDLVGCRAKREIKNITIEHKLRDFIDLIIIGKSLSEKNIAISFINSILKDKYFYKDCLGDDLIWRVCRLLLNEMGSYFDIEKLLANELLSEDKSIFGYFLSVSSSLALFDSMHLKQFFYEFCKQKVEPMLFSEFEKEESSVFYTFMNFLIDKAHKENLIMLLPLKKIISSITSDGETSQIVHQKIYDLIYNPLIAQAFDNILIENNEVLLRKFFVLKAIISSTKKNILQLQSFKDFVNKITDDIFLPTSNKTHISFVLIFDIYITLASMKLIDFNLMHESKTTLEYIGECVFTNIWACLSGLEEGSIHNYASGVFFEVINLLIEKETPEVISNKIMEIEKITFECTEKNLKPKKYSTTVLIKLMQFIRKIIPFIEMFTDKFVNTILNDLLVICQNKVVEMNDKNLAIENSLEEFNDNLMIEIAETLARISINIKGSLDFNLIFGLMNSKIPIIQKSAFLLLKHYIYNVSPEKSIIRLAPLHSALLQNSEDDEQEKRQLPIEDVDDPLLKLIVTNPSEFFKKGNNYEGENEEHVDMDVEEFERKRLITTKKIGYLLSWSCLLYQFKTNCGGEYVSMQKDVIKKLIGSSKTYYHNFLNLLFKWIKELRLTEKEQRLLTDGIKPLKYDPEWYEYLDPKDHIHLSIHVFYLFSRSFPKNLREWHEKADKNLKILANYYLKNVVSSSIFNYEIENIELKTQEWKSEEFDINVYKNTQQIIAIFTKEGAKLEISLKIPDSYPIQLINIELSKKMKFPEAKMKKWIIMMKSVLQNENSSILDSLLIWKKNVDKEFEGVEECPICYYVIHSGTNELPKMGCKTCKHLFHSSCIHKWFTSSNKSECPLCKSQFL